MAIWFDWWYRTGGTGRAGWTELVITRGSVTYRKLQVHYSLKRPEEELHVWLHVQYVVNMCKKLLKYPLYNDCFASLFYGCYLWMCIDRFKEFPSHSFLNIQKKWKVSSICPFLRSFPYSRISAFEVWILTVLSISTLSKSKSNLWVEL